MKIVHLSVSDKVGAFEATRRLHEAFRDSGHQSVIIVREKRSFDKDVIQYKSFFRLQKIWDSFTNTIVRADPDYYFFNPQESISFSNVEGILPLLPYTPDIIMIHWVSGFVNTKTIYEIQKRTHAKIFWLMLDMAPMTGGCHYAWECKGYQKRCGNCPAIHSQSSRDISSMNLLIKQEYLRKIQPVIIAPSDELYNQCKKSTLFKKSIIHKILLPLDLNEFYPGHKNELRERYTILPRKKVICFRSDNPNQRRKGFYYILKCLDCLYKLNIRNIHVAIIGNISESDKRKIVFPYTIFSSINNNRELGDIYRLSDVFLCASIQDSGPMMINESIASGLPVVSFPVGVTKDLIIDEKTGFIAQMKDSRDLAKKVQRVFSMNAHSYNEITKFCRKLAVEKLGFHPVMKQYEQIF